MVRIASVPIVALTPVPVRADNTLGIDCTVTRIDTVLIPTGQDLGAFLIYHTLRLGAGNIRVSPVAGGTVAPSPVVSALTQSVSATLGEAAGEDAVPVDALVSQRALQITLTPG